jgi:hypothetical protein
MATISTGWAYTGVTSVFPPVFLKGCVYALPANTRRAVVHVTPWKSLLVKNIDHADRPAWGSLLNKHRLNVRHAANELNWQTEDQCPEGLALKATTGTRV